MLEANSLLSQGVLLPEFISWRRKKKNLCELAGAQERGRTFRAWAGGKKAVSRIYATPFPQGAPRLTNSIILAFYILITVVWETFQN